MRLCFSFVPRVVYVKLMRRMRGENKSVKLYKPELDVEGPAMKYCLMLG